MVKARRTSAKVITYETINSFQGGITAQTDKVQIPKGMSPMARNVEWLDRGGFFVRKGVGALTFGKYGKELAPIGGIPSTFYHYVRDPSALAEFVSQYLVAMEDGSLRLGVDFGTVAAGAETAWRTLAYAAGGAFLTVGPPVFAAWDTKLYVSVGVAATNALGVSMAVWDGTNLAPLGKVYVNDLTAPTGGNMPPARYIVGWSERLWSACIIPDSGPIQGQRIRWSHPGRPEDWASSDYIDVGQQGDVITGIASMRDMLVVFKRSSMYALLGSGSTTFRVVEISGTIGCTGEWTRDNQGAVVFWDATLGACRFDGKTVTNIFEPLGRFMSAGAGGSITRCGGVVTDGEKVYVATDFVDFYGDRVPTVVGRRQQRHTGPIFAEALPPPNGHVIYDPPPEPEQQEVEPRTTTDLIPGLTKWSDLVAVGGDWSALAGVRWMRAAIEFYSIVWVWRPGAGWTSFSLIHPDAAQVTMLGQVRSRVSATGDVQSNRRIVYGLSSATTPLYLSDRYDNGKDWWTQDDQRPIDAFYMTPWLHGGVPAGTKRFRAPHIIQEADDEGTLLLDVYYDFNYDFLRRTLKIAIPPPGLAFDSYMVGKPGTCGRAKAIMLVIRPEQARHWGVSSITIPVNPKIMR
jgi:hypothetical protein